jgi:hypothetical protein
VGGLGIGVNTATRHLFLNTYEKSAGISGRKGPTGFDKLEADHFSETLATGMFCEPLRPTLLGSLEQTFPGLATQTTAEAQRSIWAQYCTWPASRRAKFIRDLFNIPSVTISAIERLATLFGPTVGHDAHMFPVECRDALAASVSAPALISTGWYDWGLNDALDMGAAASARPSARARRKPVGYHAERAQPSRLP